MRVPLCRSHEVPRAPPPQVQLHLVEMIKAKKSGAGHKMYKVCRRVLTGPIVKEDTYCLEVVGKELRGEGEVNAAGQKEGQEEDAGEKDSWFGGSRYCHTRLLRDSRHGSNSRASPNGRAWGQSFKNRSTNAQKNM